MTDNFIKDFYQKMANVNLNSYGILDFNNKIHTLGTDSKIIGRIFEMFTQPILEEMAFQNNLILKTPDSQTVYPDFILMDKETSKEKIAVDVKTTYISNTTSTIKFTLGAYCSYLRNNTKNIEYRYTDYKKHYVIGFVYERNGDAQESNVFDIESKSDIVCPYCNVRYFIQEKYKIAGEKPGSGNTENIGSFPTNNFELIKNGCGPFNDLGPEVFDLYWKYYPKYRAINQEYKDIIGFIKWYKSQNSIPTLLYPYDYHKISRRIDDYCKKNNIECLVN